jgi:hypothetical protein
LPPRVGEGQPKKVTTDILDLIDIGTIKSLQQSFKALNDEIHSRFDTFLSRATIANVRDEFKFRYQPARHVQSLSLGISRTESLFCQEMLQQPEEFSLIHFSDESRFSMEADKRWAGIAELRKICRPQSILKSFLNR